MGCIPIITIKYSLLNSMLFAEFFDSLFFL